MVGDRAEEKVKKKRSKTDALSKLSFAMDDEEEGGGAAGAGPGGEAKKNKKKKQEEKSGKLKGIKNPSVDTSFLPDREREEKDRLAREELRQQWLAKQEIMKGEAIEITYSYWDGSGHRKSVAVSVFPAAFSLSSTRSDVNVTSMQCKKGDTIAQFLEKCRQQFPELRGVSVDSLMYIKEDLIIPHHFSFYDFIVSKARGKSGPLFSFDVHDDVRMLADATVEKDESHAGKVVERTWYNRNKHIFPASRWELYEPGKDFGSYSVHDRKK
ncbi:hypothetical protein L7F22_007863 [Adiantum nelumboides]|nr:hypothetical protein [Adiantum nelumboides]